MSSISNCELCAAIDNSRTNSPKLFNAPLHETKYFQILPSIGPLTIGHVLIISKQHFNGLGSMTGEQISEIIDIARKLFANQKDLLLTEHGGYLEQAGGACIDHTHIHVLPKLAVFNSILDEVLPRISAIHSLQDLVKLSQLQRPYILNVVEGEVIVYEAYNAHSQMMRKAICSKTNRLDWDWKRDPNVPKVLKTIQAWKYQ